MAKFFFFYSRTDTNSAKAVELMTKFGIEHLFNAIGIEKDRSGQRPTLVKQLRVTTIPAIHAHNKLYEGQACFDLLKKLAGDPQLRVTVQNEVMPSSTPGFALGRKPILPPNFRPEMAIDKPNPHGGDVGGDYSAVLNQFEAPKRQSELDVFGAPVQTRPSATSDRMKDVWG